MSQFLRFAESPYPASVHSLRGFKTKQQYKYLIVLQETDAYFVNVGITDHKVLNSCDKDENISWRDYVGIDDESI